MYVLDQSQLFIASHSSGYMYVYNEEYSCAANAPTYVNLKQVFRLIVHFRLFTKNRLFTG